MDVRSPIGSLPIIELNTSSPELDGMPPVIKAPSITAIVINPPISA